MCSIFQKLEKKNLNNNKMKSNRDRNKKKLKKYIKNRIYKK